jgi:hypothetical protein
MDACAAGRIDVRKLGPLNVEATRTFVQSVDRHPDRIRLSTGIRNGAGTRGRAFPDVDKQRRGPVRPIQTDLSDAGPATPQRSPRPFAVESLGGPRDGSCRRIFAEAISQPQVRVGAAPELSVAGAYFMMCPGAAARMLAASRRQATAALIGRRCGRRRASRTRTSSGTPEPARIRQETVVSCRGTKATGLRPCAGT